MAETKGVEVEPEFPTVCVVGKVGHRSYCKQTSRRQLQNVLFTIK